MGFLEDERFRDQVFLVHPQTSLRFVAETTVEWSPDRGPRSGLLYQADEDSQFCLRVDWDLLRKGGTLGLLVFDRGELFLPLGNEEPLLAPEPVRLRLEVDRLVRFFWTQGDRGWEPLGPALEAGVTDGTGPRFEGAFVGLVWEDGEGREPPSCFSLSLDEAFE